MADVTKIKLPDNSTVNIKDYRIPGVDTVPTSGSNNLITSGGVYQELEDGDWVTTEEYTQIEGVLKDTYTKEEVDEIIDALPASNITTYDIQNWNDKVSNIQADWTATTGDAVILHKPTLATVATSGSYNDLTNKPTIPTESTVAGWGFIKQTSGGVNSVKVGSTTYNPSNGVVSLPAYPTTLPASDVSAWAKASTKPTYTATEVGALPSTTTIPTATTAIDDNKYIPNGTTVDTKIAGLGISNSNLLSGNNVFVRTNANNPLFGLKEGSNLWYCQAASNKFYFGPTSTKALSLDQNGNGNFTGSLTANSIIKSGGTSSQFLKADGSVDSNTYALASSVPAAQVQSDWNATSGMGVILNKPTIPAAVTESTVSGWGFTKNAAPGTLNTTATAAQTTSSSEALSGSITLHKVAKTGTYSDLIGTPTIPAAPGTLITNATTAQTASSGQSMSGSITLHKVAKTGTYSDLIGTPTIPTVNNATLTIQKNGTTVNTFTANASSNVTANIQVNEVPSYSTSNNGQILSVVGGSLTWVTPAQIYSGSANPSNSTGNNGDIYLQM